MNDYKPEGYLISTPENLEYTRSCEGLARALARGAILEGIVTLCDHNMNLHISLGGMRGIIPRGEVQFSPTGEPIKDIAVLTRVGKPVAFRIMGFERTGAGENVAVLSRREAQEECYENYIKGLIPGDIIPTKITHLENFGAFVDIGCGITSLLSIDTISVSRISHPRARLKEGDMLYTVVRSIDERGRIFVSERELLGSWEENAALFREGDTVRGVVRSVESFGVFVELMPNLAGLAEWREDARPGMTAAVYIKSIIPEKMKIKLIIIDIAESSEELPPLQYFVDTESVTHLESWVYSPESCKRVIETVF